MDNHVEEEERYSYKYPRTRPKVLKPWWKGKVERNSDNDMVRECMCHIGIHSWTYEEEEHTDNMKRYCTECHRIENVEGI